MMSKTFRSSILKASVIAIVVSVMPVASQAFVDISLGVNVGLPVIPMVAVAPPPLPVYVVPPPPAPSLIWAPGHWLWGDFGYYWVPGTWVAAPAPGLLWTPGYWGWRGGSFAWNEGYWGPHVGFYGGINYGGGYGGVGFFGGGWHGGNYVVNRSVTNVTNITNVNNVTNINNHASFNGGPGGTNAQPNAQERMAMQEHHVQPTAEQVNHINAARNNPQFRASANGGKPPVAATTHPGHFSGPGVIAARRAGPVNAAAEQHNQQVMHNPSMAHGALPGQHNQPAAERPAVAHASPAYPRSGQHQQFAAPQHEQQGQHMPQAQEHQSRPQASAPQHPPRPAVRAEHRSQEQRPQQQERKPEERPEERRE